MPKTKTISPQFSAINGPSADTLTLILVPRDTLGKQRGDVFALAARLDGTQLLGPDGSIVAAPVPAAILNASIATGGAPIQAEIDALDGAGALNAYY